MTIRTIGNLNKYINIFTFYFLILITLILNPNKAVWAHSPHDIIDVLEISPAYEHDNTLYIVRANKLKISTDGGYRWKFLANGLDNRHTFTDIAISPAFHDDKTMFVASSGDGIYKSIDGGVSWIKSNNGLNNMSISMLSMSSIRYDGRLFAVDSNGGLHTTDNGGANWYQLSNKNKITAVTFLNDSDNNYIITGDDTGAVHRSNDNGESWQQCNQISNNGSVTTIISSPNFSLDSTLFVGTETGGILKSDDGCISFNKINNGLTDKSITSIAISPQYNEDKTILASGWDEAVFISRDGGENWKKFNEGLSWDKQAKTGMYWSPNFIDLKIANVSEASARMFLAGFDGLFKSESGEAWTELETLPVSLIMGMAVAPTDRNNTALSITTYGGGAYITYDHGLTWSIKNRGLTTTRLSDIVFSPGYSSDNTVYSASRGYILKSEGDNNNWNKLKLSLPSWRTRLVALFHKMRFPDSAYKYVREKILTHAEKEGRPFPTVIALSPNFKTDKTMYFGTRYDGVFVSTDGGQHSSLLWDANGNVIRSLVISPDFVSDSTLFVHVRGLGVYKTMDGGKSWQLLEIDNPGIKDRSRLIISPNYGEDKTVYIASSVGLFHTTDGGSSWKHLQAFRGSYILDMSISPNYKIDSQIIISVKGEGLFKSLNSGVIFEKIAPYLIINNHEMEWIEFSSSYDVDPSLYAASYEEIFQSDDGGNTWHLLSRNRPVRYENRRDVINYSSDWEIEKGNEYSASSISYSDIAGSTAFLNFVGTGINVIGAKSSNCGIANVYIDGTYQKEVDLYSEQQKNMVKVYSIEGLDNGSHNISIEVASKRNPKSTGNRITIDAIDVLP